jgi:tetratricopeptide (TPR) repeat protein
MPPQQTIDVPRPFYRQTGRNSFETASVWTLIAALIVSLFIFIPSSLIPIATTKTFILAAGTIVTLTIYVLARLGRGNIIFPPSILVGALWLPVLAYALSSAFSGVAFGNAVWGLSIDTETLGLMFVVACLGTLSAFILRRSEHYQSFLCVGALVFGIVAVLEVLIIIVGQFSPETISPSFSIIGSFDDLASFLGLGVIGTLITFRFLELSSRSRFFLIATGIVALVLLVIANSSLVWTIVALVSFGLFVETIMKRGPRSTDSDLDETTIIVEDTTEESDGNNSFIPPLIVFAISLFFLVGGTLGSAVASSLHVDTLSVRPSWQSTFFVAKNVYANNLIFGSGPGTFGIEWLKYRDASLNSTVFWNIDFLSGIGFIPTSFVTTGLVGAVAWIVFAVLFIVLGLRMLIKRAPENVFMRYVAILSFVSFLYLISVAIFGLPNAVILALTFVFAGIFASTMRFSVGGEQWGVIFSRNPRLGFVIVLSLMAILLASVMAAYMLVGRYVATAELAKANGAFVSGRLEDAAKSAENAFSFAKSATAYQIKAGIANARIGKILADPTMPVESAQKEFQAALSTGISAALSATQLASSDYKNWVVLGNLYSRAVPFGVSGAYDGAANAYEKARELNPTNPQIPFILAQLDIANKDIKSAKENLKKAIALKQDYTVAIFLLSQLEVQDGNVKDALTAALAAAYFSPNDPNILFQIGVLRAAQNDLAGANQALSLAVSANPQFANARYFLSAVYAKQGDLTNALTQMEAVAAMSEDNAKAVASQLEELRKDKNPFPANLLSISPAQVNP